MWFLDPHQQEQGRGRIQRLDLSDLMQPSPGSYWREAERKRKSPCQPEYFLLRWPEG